MGIFHCYVCLPEGTLIQFPAPLFGGSEEFFRTQNGVFSPRLLAQLAQLHSFRALQKSFLPTHFENMTEVRGTGTIMEG